MACLNKNKDNNLKLLLCKNCGHVFLSRSISQTKCSKCKLNTTNLENNFEILYIVTSRKIKIRLSKIKKKGDFE